MRTQAGSLGLLVGMGMLMSASAAVAQIPVSKEGPPPQPTQPTQPTMPTTRVDTAPTAMTPAPTTPPATVIEVSSGDLELYRGATDANVVAHIIAGDSAEIQMSQLALARSSNPTIREYAQMMIDQHSRNTANFVAMQADESIGIEPLANDPIAMQDRSMLNAIRNMTGEAFDRAYIRAQVAHHDADAAALQQMADAARDNDLEQDIEEQLLPVIRQHLVRAREIAATMNVDVSRYMMTTTP